MKVIRNKTEYWFRLSLDQFYLIPWVKNDGYRGFIHYLLFHLNWYPKEETKCLTI